MSISKWRLCTFACHSIYVCHLLADTLLYWQISIYYHSKWWRLIIIITDYCNNPFIILMKLLLQHFFMFVCFIIKVYLSLCTLKLCTLVQFTHLDLGIITVKHQMNCNYQKSFRTLALYFLNNNKIILYFLSSSLVCFLLVFFIFVQCI